jgi:hypothetical protein
MRKIIGLIVATGFFGFLGFVCLAGALAHPWGALLFVLLVLAMAAFKIFFVEG